MTTTVPRPAPFPPSAARRVGPTPAPPPSTAGNGPPVSPRQFSVSSGRMLGAAQRIMIYGPGGVGKTTLASLSPNPVFLDVEQGTRQLDVPRVDGLEIFDDLRACLQSNALDGYGTLVLDSATKTEELAIAHTLSTVRTDKGDVATSVESYSYGRGLQHVYETYLLLLQDLDRHIHAGRNIILIAHDCTANVPHPAVEDYLRFEPHLQTSKSGRASIRNRVVQWTDHCFFLGYDVFSKDGKGLGQGTRTIWPIDRPSHIAKSRILTDPMPFDSPTNSAVWDLIFQKNRGAT